MIVIFTDILTILTQYVSLLINVLFMAVLILQVYIYNGYRILSAIDVESVVDG